MQGPPSNDDLVPDDSHLRNELAAPVREWCDWSQTLSQAREWLDTLHVQMALRGELERGMLALHQGLSALRQQASEEGWRRLCLTVAQAHPLRELLHHCPFTRRSFERPRGYAGDAVLLDYLYTEQSLGLEHPGRDIYRFMFRQPSPRSVRERRERLAREIDTTAALVPGARILSVACGHLREAELSHAVAEHRLGALYAMDQDALSLGEIQQHFPHGPVQTVHGSVRALLVDRLRFEPLDLIYSAGLYDYLSDPLARRLTRRLFDMLEPGGRLVLANFSPRAPEAGYMEAFMDWWLIYREEAGMLALTEEIDPDLIASRTLSWDTQHNVIYMVLTRR
jgi:extracellular factor (EF) 3-hydroxypalmitic acid methyl ester biosynthesis protein